MEPSTVLRSSSPRGPKRRFPWNKVLIGCGLGCGLLGLLGVLAAAFGIGWIVSPGKQVATDHVVGEESLGAIQLRRSTEDSGVSAFLSELIIAIQRADTARQDLPESMRWLEQIQEAQQRQGTGGMNLFIPKQATLSFEPVQPRAGSEEGVEGEGYEEAPTNHFVAALNFRAFPRLVKAFVEKIAEDDTESILDYREHRLVVFEDGGGLVFVDSTFLASDDLDSLKRALDRVLDREEGAPGMGPLSPSSAPPDFVERWDLWGNLDNRDGQLREVLENGEFAMARILEPGHTPWFLLPEADFGTLGAVLFGFDLDSADRLLAELRLDCATEESAAAWQKRVTAIFTPYDPTTPPAEDLPAEAMDAEAVPSEASPELAEAPPTPPERILDAVVDVRREGRRIVAEIDIRGLTALLTHWAEAMMEMEDYEGDYGEYEDYGEYDDTGEAENPEGEAAPAEVEIPN